MKKALFYVLSATTLMFTGLKLAGKIDWSWWWVTSPVWMPLAALAFITLASQCFLLWQYRHDERFRKVMDGCREARKKQNRTLTDEVADMKRRAEELRRQREERE